MIVNNQNNVNKISKSDQVLHSVNLKFNSFSYILFKNTSPILFKI